MQIILVVFDKKSFQLSGKIVGEIDSYIDANYVKKQRSTEYFGRGRSRRNRFEPEIDEAYYEEMLMMHPDVDECILQQESIGRWENGGSYVRSNFRRYYWKSF